MQLFFQDWKSLPLLRSPEVPYLSHTVFAPVTCLACKYRAYIHLTNKSMCDGYFVEYLLKKNQNSTNFYRSHGN
jgi:hypothetical protein